MSLINQVLQDLQQRHAADANSTSATLHDVRVSPRYDKRSVVQPWMMWVLIVVLASVSSLLLWQKIQPESARPPVPTALEVDKKPAVVAPAQKLASPPTAVPAALVVQPPVVVPAPASVPPPIAETKAEVKTGAPVMATPPAASKDLPITPPNRIDKTPSLATPSARPAKVAKTLRPLAPEQQADLDYQDARRLLQSGRPSAAEPRLRAALAVFAEHRAARESLAALMINAGRLGEARALLRTGVEMAPIHAPFATLYARLLIDANDLATARTVLERAAPSVQVDPDYHALLAALYQRAGLYEQAAQTYRGTLQIQPRNGVWWLGLGLALEGGGDKTSALQAYQRAEQSGTLTPDVLRYVETKIAALR